MQENSSKNDPSANWPEEIKQAYEHLKVPTLYDALLANEKLSLEIRRQDRDLKAVLEGIQFLSNQFNSLIKIVEEEWEEIEDENPLQENENGFLPSSKEELINFEKELFQEKQAKAILMETHDNLRDLSRIIRQAIQQLMALLPRTEGIIPHPPSWYPIVEEILQGVVENTERSRYQLLTRLEDLYIEMVDPHPGELFDPSFHHALDHVSGGKSGTIAHVVRVGYRQQEQMIRLAEVTIYQ